MDGHGVKPAIEMFFPCDSRAPFLEVILEEPLVELVEDVRGNTYEEVGVRKIGPEGREDGAKALSDELGEVLTGGLCVENTCCLLLIAQRESSVCTALVSRHMTLWAAVLSATCYQTLFWVVPNERCEYWVDLPDTPVCAHSLYALASRSHQRLQH